MRFALQPEWKEADINIGWSAHNPPPRLTNSQEHQLTMMILWWFLAYQFFSQHVSKAKLRGVLLRRPAHPDDDDTYVMVKCLSVWHEKVTPPYSKDFVVSPVSRHIQNLVTPPLPYSKDLVVSPVSKHFPYSKVSRNSKTTKSLEIMTFQGILLFLLFLDTFRRDEQENRKVTKSFEFSKNVTHAGHRPTF